MLSLGGLEEPPEMRSLRSGGGYILGKDEGYHPIGICHDSSTPRQGSIRMRSWYHCPSVCSDDVRLTEDFEAIEADPP